MKRIVLVIFLLCVSCQKSFQNPPLRVFPDMDDQKKVKPQSEFALFKHSQSLQHSVDDTIARGSLVQQKNTDIAHGEFLYSTYCLPCHGETGKGFGPVSKREAAALLRPPSLVDGATKNWSDEEIFNLITRGRGLMRPYAHLIDSADRWAIVKYIRKLQSGEQ